MEELLLKSQEDIAEKRTVVKDLEEEHKELKERLEQLQRKTNAGTASKKRQISGNNSSCGKIDHVKDQKNGEIVQKDGKIDEKSEENVTIKKEASRRKEMIESAVGSAEGLQRAHDDFCAFWYKRGHGKFIDSLLHDYFDGISIEREFFGYALIFLTLFLLFTKAAPLIAGLLCTVYPIRCSFAVFYGKSQDFHRIMVYWSMFAFLSVWDSYFSQQPVYWIFKVVVCVYLYLPQTQGALYLYSNIIEPVIFKEVEEQPK